MGSNKAPLLLRLEGVTVETVSITSGLVADPADLDLAPPEYRVSWIAWSSGFRGSGLQIGDRIIAVDSERVTRPATVEEPQRVFPSAIGQYAEAQRWTQRGTVDGQHCKLTIAGALRLAKERKCATSRDR